MILLFPHQHHIIKTNKNSSLVIFIFSPELVEDFYQLTNGYLFDFPVLQLPSEILTVAKNTLLEKTSNFKKKAFLYLVIDHYLNHSKLIEIKHSDKLIIDEVLSYLETNFTRHITLHDVSDKLNYSYNYLSGLINDNLNISFTTLLNAYRINYSLNLIKDSSFSLTRISDKIGFQNTRSFNRNFKLIMNMTPTDFKSNRL